MTFRSGLLDGRRVAVAGPGTDGADDVVVGRLWDLGARVEVIDPGSLSDEAWAQHREPFDALVFLGAEPFGAGGGDRLQGTLELAWRAARGVGLHAEDRGGRIVFVVPSPTAGPHAEAARAGLENLARTLSVEWARFGVTAVAVAPGPATTAAEVGELVAYLLSEAGAYLSGCRLALGEAAPAPAA